MKPLEPLRADDPAFESQDTLHMSSLNLSEEELTELDRRIAEIDALDAAGMRMMTAEEFFAQQRAKYRIAS